MSAIAERCIGGTFASTKEHFLIFPWFVLYRLETRSLVRTIAVRLILTQTTGTPEVRFACYKLFVVGLVLGNFWQVFRVRF